MAESTVSGRRSRVSGRTLIHCAQCNGELWLYVSQIKLSQRHFCTRRCRDAYRAVHHWGNPRLANSRKCHECGADIYRAPSRAAAYKHHFCDDRCKNAWRAKHAVHGAANGNFRGGSFAKCGHCGKDVWVVPSKAKRLKRHFCNVDCRDAAFTKTFSEPEKAKRRLDCNICHLVQRGLKGRKAGRSWEVILGYTLEELIIHLESLFVEGMSWENYGKWHVDHRRPRASFRYTSPDDEQFKLCWSLLNLQPLWSIENRRKGAQLDWKPTSC